MSDIRRFGDRALDCRTLAKSDRPESDHAVLEEIADELDAQADKIEIEAPNPERATASSVELEDRALLALLLGRHNESI
jgi:hypothetical protein